MLEIFSHKDEIRWAARIVKGILEADSPRVSDIERAMGVHSPEATCRIGVSLSGALGSARSAAADVFGRMRSTSWGT